MKTKEELRNEFRTKLEEKRRREVKHIAYELPIALFLCMFLTFVLIYVEHSLILSHKIAWSIAIFIFLSTAITVAMWQAVEYKLDEFDIRSYYKQARSWLKENRQKLITLETKINDAEIVTALLKESVSQLHEAEVTSTPPDPVWILYLVGLEKSSRQNFQNLRNQRIALLSEIDLKKAEIYVYRTTPEKNMWQYLRSMKWTKKVKTIN